MHPDLHLDCCAELAVAVADLARREAAAGDPAAITWLDQVRRDILDEAPAWAAEQWAQAVPPAELLAEAYQARKAAGASFLEAVADLGGSSALASAYWRREPPKPPRRAGWPPWAAPFLEAVAAGVRPAEAARRAGTPHTSPYQLARFRPDFAEAWAAARTEGEGRKAAA